ncbi:Predicted PurR-regulated permease PerM [Salinimicrobium catena]|uniref:Predicted PurR-regulated permease PerM n=1 Tax=Salinimicrobium catena TaxID=390640 RepID=A0A1H5NIH6_9FLAO|nr:AI-2E family transporter [Salinimicrobium catena]SDL45924.1 Predicted PurR-regulated permease PerM [Salinimicrobium catena]SEF00671.1 Predicted PurR-regulated permease PerM [Salinimicrobium catena]
MNRLKPSLVRQLFVLLLILFLLVLIFKEIVPYLSGVLGAITLHVILRKSMGKLVNKGWKPVVAASFLIFLSFVGILVPISLTVIMLTSKIGKAVANSEKVLQAVKNQINEAETYVGYDLSKGIDSARVANWLSNNLQSLGAGTFNAFIAIGIMYFMLYYMLIHRDELKKLVISYIPLGEDNLRTIGVEGDELVRSNALGIPLVAFFQGIVALIGYLIVSVPDPLFWFVITAIGAMIPFIGTAVGVVPVAILLFSQGMDWQAIFILIYGFVIVGITDNILRLYILNRLASVHPLITLFGVVVGVPLFGFIGLIFGPLLISLFLLILKIYKHEYGKTEDKI